MSENVCVCGEPEDAQIHKVPLGHDFERTPPSYGSSAVQDVPTTEIEAIERLRFCKDNSEMFQARTIIELEMMRDDLHADDPDKDTIKDALKLIAQLYLRSHPAANAASPQREEMALELERRIKSVDFLMRLHPRPEGAVIHDESATLANIRATLVRAVAFVRGAPAYTQAEQHTETVLTFDATKPEGQQFGQFEGVKCPTCGVGYVPADAKASAQWKKIKDEKPKPHRLYIVRRDGRICYAKVCYGMHSPWWVVQTFGGEAEPIDMRQDDEWQEVPTLET